MQQEDFIKRQIDQLGRVLGKILADIMGTPTLGQLTECMAAADRELKSEMGFTLNELHSIPAELFIKTLQGNKKLNNDNYDTLADIFFHLAELLRKANNDLDRMQGLYARALMIYEHLDNTSSTYSFERQIKVGKIKVLPLPNAN